MKNVDKNNVINQPFGNGKHTTVYGDIGDGLWLFYQH